MALGQLVHFSIPVVDMSAGTKFYGGLFNWKFQEMTPTYTLVEGGIGSLSVETITVSKTMPILYFEVPDIATSLRMAEQKGGKTILPKTDAGDGRSFFATLSNRTALLSACGLNNDEAASLRRIR